MKTIVINASSTSAAIEAATKSLQKALRKSAWADAHKVIKAVKKRRVIDAEKKIAAAQRAEEAHASNVANEATELLKKEVTHRKASNKEARRWLLPELNAANAAQAWITPRTYEKAEKASLWNYTFHGFKANSVFAHIVNEVVRAADAAKDGDDAEACRIFAAVEESIQQQLAANKPFVAYDSKAVVQIGRQSEMAELLRIAPHDETRQLVEIEHRIVDVRTAAKGLMKAIGAGDRLEGVKRIIALQETMVKIMVNAGVDVKREDGTTENYVVLAYTASKGKSGSVYAVPRSYAEKAEFIEAMTLKQKLHGENAVPTSAAEVIKMRAVLFTPSTPIVTANGERLYLHDIAMFPAIKRHIHYAKAIVVDKNGIRVVYDAEDVRNEGDGAMYYIDINSSVESGQLRGHGIKAMLVNMPGIVERIAEMLGVAVPDLKGKKLIATSDVWKWSKIGLSWDEFVQRVESLQNVFPTIGMLRIVRNADAVEETGRKASRQLLQQFVATNNVAEAVEADERWLNRFKTLEGAAEVYSGGKHKADNERTAFEMIFKRVPNVLASEQMTADVEDRWNEHFANAAYGRLMVEGSYPYIVTDPVAIIKILLFGANPDTEQGLLSEGYINAPGLRDLQEVLITRYPCNFFCSMTVKNTHFTEDMKIDLREVYGSIGNVMVLPYNSIILVLADGDVDGDEMSIIENDWYVRQFKAAMSFIHQDEVRVPILFPHDKAPLQVFATKRDLNDAIAKSILLANTYGGEVGKNSLLATRSMHNAMINREDRLLFNQYLFDAIYAYIGSIIAIDLVKTGVYPRWLQKKLSEVKEHAGKLPWNQAFRENSMETPWYKTLEFEAHSSDPVFQPESKDAIVDKIARCMLDNCAEEDGLFHFDVQGQKFDVTVLLNDKYGNYGVHKSVLNESVVKQIQMRNCIDADIEDRTMLRNTAEGKLISPSELLRFFWRNSAALTRKMIRPEADNSREADWLQRQEYYSFCREVLIGMDETIPEADREAVVANWAINMAFRDNNGIGKNKTPEVRKAMKGRFCRFVLQVFAIDALRNVEINLDVPEAERFDTIHTEEGAQNIAF